MKTLKLPPGWIAYVAAMTLALSFQAVAKGQIYLATYGDPSHPHDGQITGISKYSLTGELIDPTLIATPIGTVDLAIKGSEIFITRNQPPSVGKYTTSGEPINTSLIPAVDATWPGAIVESGGYLYISGARQYPVGKYTTDGAVVNSHLVTINQSVISGGPLDFAIVGDTIYATQIGVGQNGNGYVGAYSTSGQIINQFLITGLYSPTGIAVHDDKLFIAEGNASRVSVYTTSGTLVSSNFLPFANSPTAIAIADDTIYLVCAGGDLQTYTTSGDLINAHLITGLGYVPGIVVVVPEPSSAILALVATVALACWTWRRTKPSRS